jgi:hypothetical protein
MPPAVQFVRFVPIGAALAAAQAGGLAYNARLYGVPGATATAIAVHVLRFALLVIVLVVLALRGAPGLAIAALAFAGTHGPVAALLARRR